MLFVKQGRFIQLSGVVVVPEGWSQIAITPSTTGSFSIENTSGGDVLTFSTPIVLGSSSGAWDIWSSVTITPLSGTINVMIDCDIKL